MTFPKRCVLLPEVGAPRLGSWASKALCVIVAILLTFACTPAGKKSSAAARIEVVELVKAASEDVRELHDGLPVGADAFAKLLPDTGLTGLEPSEAREALLKVRNRVQDLRVAKFDLLRPRRAHGCRRA